MTRPPFKLALIGCGDHARQQHAAPLSHWAKEHPGKIELIAACDPIPERANQICAQFGFAQSFTDMHEMLDRISPDACVSVPPPHLNAPIGIELLHRRIPCVIEKPPGTSMQEVNQLAAIANQTGTPHMISMNRRFNPYLNRALQWCKSAGPLLRIFARMYRVNRTEPEFIWGTGIHAIDAVRYLGGNVETFKSAGQNREYRIVLQFVNRVSAAIDIQPETDIVEEAYELIGRNRRAEVRIDGAGRTELRGWVKNHIQLEQVSPAEEANDITCGAYAETDHFITAMLNGTRLSPTIHEIVPSMRIAFSG